MDATSERRPSLRWRWERAAREKMPNGVNLTAQAVAWQLASYGNEHGESIRPSLGRLAAAMGVAEKTVSAARTRLVRAGMIEEARKASPGFAPVYRLCDPSQWSDLARDTATEGTERAEEVEALGELTEELAGEHPAEVLGLVRRLHARFLAQANTEERSEVQPRPNRPAFKPNPERAAQMRAAREAEPATETDDDDVEKDELDAEIAATLSEPEPAWRQRGEGRPRWGRRET